VDGNFKLWRINSQITVSENVNIYCPWSPVNYSLSLQKLLYFQSLSRSSSASREVLIVQPC